MNRSDDPVPEVVTDPRAVLHRKRLVALVIAVVTLLLTVATALAVR